MSSPVSFSLSLAQWHGAAVFGFGETSGNGTIEYQVFGKQRLVMLCVRNNFGHEDLEC